MQNIVIVGGGAGGIELAAMLGRKFGKRNTAKITLIDATATHLWKPLLHEVAAGSLNSNEDEINYLAYASTHYFHFSQGTMTGLNRAEKKIFLAPLLDEQGQAILPERTVSYDILIIAVGSVANDFGIPGVRENCFFLDSRKQADYFHTKIHSVLRVSPSLFFSSKKSLHVYPPGYTFPGQGTSATDAGYKFFFPSQTISVIDEL